MLLSGIKLSIQTIRRCRTNSYGALKSKNETFLKKGFEAYQWHFKFSFLQSHVFFFEIENSWPLFSSCYWELLLLLALNIFLWSNKVHKVLQKDLYTFSWQRITYVFEFRLKPFLCSIESEFLILNYVFVVVLFSHSSLSFLKEK